MTLVLVVVVLTLRVQGHHLQPQQTSLHVHHLGWVERLCSPLVVVLYSLLDLQYQLGPSVHTHLGPLNRGDSTAGLKFLRYRRFLSVTLPDPSTLTDYISKPRSSSTTPVLSHLLAKFPAAFWFCKETCCPEISFGKTLLCSAYLSPPKLTLWRSACFHCSLEVIQVSAGL